MFGYRLVRERDWDAVTAAQTVQAEKLDTATAKIESLLRELLEARSAERSAKTAYDHVTVRVNALEVEAATFRHKVTGLPQTAPQIGKGQPLMSDTLGGGVDLFADVGDEKADVLQRAGLLHEDAAPLPELPSAATLSAGAVPH